MKKDITLQFTPDEVNVIMEGLGNLPFVKKNFGLVIIAIILISVLPAVIEALRARKAGIH